MFLNNFIRQRSRNYVIVVFICLLITLMTLCGCTASRNGKAEKVRQGITAYLQQKYGIEFEVGQPYLTGSMSTTHYQAKAHPKGKPEIEFIINDNSYMDEMGSGVYADYYLTAKWSYQGRLEVEKKLKEVYGEGVDYNVRRHKFSGGSYEFKDMDYVQVFKQSQGLGSIDLSLDIFMDAARFNQDEEATKAYQILKPFVLEFKPSSWTSFNVVYIENNLKQDYLANPEPYWDNWRILHNKMQFSDTYRKEVEDKKLLGWIHVDIMSSKTLLIDSGTDLVKYFNQ